MHFKSSSDVTQCVLSNKYILLKGTSHIISRDTVYTVSFKLARICCVVSHNLKHGCLQALMHMVVLVAFQAGGKLTSYRLHVTCYRHRLNLLGDSRRHVMLLCQRCGYTTCFLTCVVERYVWLVVVVVPFST